MPAFLSNGLFFSEIFADNIGAGGFDTDGDGVVNKADEYVEIQFNGANDSRSLNGIEIWSAKRGLLFAFPDGETVLDGETATVVGQFDGAEPPGFFDAGLPDNSSNQGLLEDGEGSRFDTLYLVDTNTGEFVSFAYGQPPQVQALPPGFTGTTEVGAESLNTGFPNGVPVGRNANGDFEESVPPTPGAAGPVCFTSDAMILTPDGEVAARDIRVGDLVTTLDHGAQVVRWTGSATVRAVGAFAPVEIAAGALGATRPLRLSQQHRILLAGARLEVLFGSPETLAPAGFLTGIPGVALRPGGFVTYHHFLFDRHEIIFANGVSAESLHPGHAALEAVGEVQAREIQALFPDLPARDRRPLARMPLRRFEVEVAVKTAPPIG